MACWNRPYITCAISAPHLTAYRQLSRDSPIVISRYLDLAQPLRVLSAMKGVLGFRKELSGWFSRQVVQVENFGLTQMIYMVF